MAKVYFTPIDSISQTKRISAGARALLERLVKDEKHKLTGTVPFPVR